MPNGAAKFPYSPSDPGVVSVMVWMAGDGDVWVVVGGYGGTVWLLVVVLACLGDVGSLGDVGAAAVATLPTLSFLPSTPKIPQPPPP